MTRDAVLPVFAVDLEQLADLIDAGQDSAGGRLDLTTGEVWPEFAFEDTFTERSRTPSPKMKTKTTKRIRTYAQLQQQATQTSELIQTLAGKLQGASAAGDPNAREWLLDLKEVTLGVQQQQSQTSLLLEAIHTMVDNHLQQTSESELNLRAHSDS